MSKISVFMPQLLLVIVLPLLCAPIGFCQAVNQPLTLTISTDTQECELGDRLALKVQITNNSEKTISILWNNANPEYGLRSETDPLNPIIPFSYPTDIFYADKLEYIDISSHGSIIKTLYISTLDIFSE